MWRTLVSPARLNLHKTLVSKTLQYIRLGYLIDTIKSLVRVVACPHCGSIIIIIIIIIKISSPYLHPSATQFEKKYIKNTHDGRNQHVTIQTQTWLPGLENKHTSVKNTHYYYIVCVFNLVAFAPKCVSIVWRGGGDGQLYYTTLHYTHTDGLGGYL